ncbi:MAG: glycosyltransferase family 2 protein [Anaerolineae bacterium]|nr:glycosyltransferase family 2 protein [Anaerolineae bacterium]
MKQQPVVSVIMPFYNTKPAFMDEAIGSVLAQQYPYWELLLIDDGSTQESSSQTARQYAVAHPDRIHYLEHPNHANKGPGASRQLAIQQARGELLAFLDADDLWLPHKLAEQVALLAAHPQVGAMYGNTLYWFKWVGDTPGNPSDFMPNLGLADGAVIIPPHLLRQFVQGGAAIPCTCSLIVQREVVIKSGGFEVDYRGFYDDQMFYAKIFLQTAVLVKHDCWDYYRQHPDSGTHIPAAPHETMKLHLNYLMWLANYLTQQQITDEQLWHALQQQIWLYHQPTWLPWPHYSHTLMRRLKKRLLQMWPTW